MRLILFFLGIAFNPLTYSEALTLHQAVVEALHDSPTVQKSESLADEASWQKVESYAGFLPTVSLTSSYLVKKKWALIDIDLGGQPMSVPQILPTGLFTLQGQIPLFDGFANWDRLRAARLNERAAAAEFDWTRFQIQRQVVLQFYKALGAKALKDVADQNIKTLEDHSRDVHLFKRAGVSTNYDVLRVDVQLSEAKSELLNAEDNLLDSRGHLAEILGQIQDTRPLSGNLPVLKADLISGKELNITDSRGDLKALQDRTEAAALQSQIAHKFWIPRLAFFGQYQYYNNENSNLTDWQAYRNAYNFGFSLTWNIFDGMQSIAKAGEASDQRFQAEKGLRLAQLKSNQDLEIWKRKFLYHVSVYAARENDIKKAEESVRLARAGRRVGARTTTDLLDAESELFKARAGAVNAQLGSIEALINLELASGKKLYDF